MYRSTSLRRDSRREVILVTLRRGGAVGKERRFAEMINTGAQRAREQGGGVKASLLNPGTTPSRP
jgi:hypothetical protein